MQTRPRGAHFASLGASNSAIRLISQEIPPHYTSLGCQTFFFLKVNGPISHQLFLRNLSRQRVKGLKAAATDFHLEVVFNRARLTRMPFGERLEGEMDRGAPPVLRGGRSVLSCPPGERGPHASAEAERVRTLLLVRCTEGPARCRRTVYGDAE